MFATVMITLVSLFAMFAVTYAMTMVAGGAVCMLLVEAHESGINLSPPLEPFKYDGGYDHLECHDYVHQVDAGEELPEGEYEEGSVTVPKAVL